MKQIFSLFICLLLVQFGMTQTVVKDSAQKAKEDSIKMKKLEAILTYPLINAGTFSGVVPVSNPDEIPDPTLNYKLLFELVDNNKATEAKDINHGLVEICRIINLHVASGIPVKNITPIIVVHAGALHSFYTRDIYQKKYNADNPNIAIVDELIKKTGARFIACGQAMNFFDVPREEMIPQVKVSLTAQTVLSHYQLIGYKLYEIRDDK
jgi:intracellular sulfur oxidation DsrE/DsrF family protein